MKQAILSFDASCVEPSAAALGDPEVVRASDAAAVGVPCSAPGCHYVIVPDDESDEHCEACGHAIACDEDDPEQEDEPECASDADADRDNGRPLLAGCEPPREPASASPRRPKKAPKPPPEPAGPRSVAARIVELCKALGIQDDAEKRTQLPF